MKFASIAAMFLIMMTAGCMSSNITPVDIEIHNIQGCGHISPLLGKSVREVQGIVTKKYTNGFVIQGMAQDEKDCSSEALFVHTSSYSDVIIGDLVSVEGVVEEFFPGTEDQHNLSQTEITKASIKTISTGNELPAPVALGEGSREFPQNVIEDDDFSIFDPQSDGLDFFESLEWMNVKLPQTRVVGARNSYNEIVVAENSNTTNIYINQTAGALVETNQDKHPERIMIQLPSNWSKKVNVGDRVAGSLTGIMSYSYGNYKIDPISKISIQKNEQTYKSEDCSVLNSNKLRIANYNINNFSQYTKSSIISYLANQIVDYLCSPDLLVLEEVQDDSGERDDGVVSADENLAILVSAIDKAGGPQYMYFDFPPQNDASGGVQGGNIRTVFLLRKDSKLKLTSSAGVELKNGKTLFLDQTKIELKPNPMQIGFDDPSFQGMRKPIIGLFEYYGQQIIVVGLHLISKGMNSPEYGNVQPIEEPELNKRMEQASYVNKWAENILSRSPGTIIVIAGDINDGFESKVLSTLQGNTFIDTAQKLEPENRFSLIRYGSAQLFDHILLSNNVINISPEIYHLNTLFDDSSKTSDHDPVMVSIEFEE